MIPRSEQLEHRKKAILAILHYFNIRHYKTGYNHNDSEVLKMSIYNLSIQDASLAKHWIRKLPWTASCVENVSNNKTIYLNIEILI